MRHLPKHVRPRWRYLAVGIETWPDADLDRRSFQREVWYAAQNLLGDPGSADADLSVVRFSFDAPAGEAIVRARRGHAERARAALACVDEVGGETVGLRVRGKSATVRACEEKYLGGRPEPSQERRVALDGEERTGHVRPPRVDVAEDSAWIGATELDLE